MGHRKRCYYDGLLVRGARVPVASHRDEEGTIGIVGGEVGRGHRAVSIKAHKELGLVVFLLCLGVEGHGAVLVVHHLDTHNMHTRMNARTLLKKNEHTIQV